MRYQQQQSTSLSLTLPVLPLFCLFQRTRAIYPAKSCWMKLNELGSIRSSDGGNPTWQSSPYPAPDLSGAAFHFDCFQKAWNHLPRQLNSQFVASSPLLRCRIRSGLRWFHLWGRGSDCRWRGRRAAQGSQKRSRFQASHRLHTKPPSSDYSVVNASPPDVGCR